MEINCYEKNNYGNTMIYCSDKETALILTELTGNKTLSESDLKNLAKLGLKINVTRLPH
jgi:hypothetical protein